MGGFPDITFASSAARPCTESAGFCEGPLSCTDPILSCTDPILSCNDPLFCGSPLSLFLGGGTGGSIWGHVNDLAMFGLLGGFCGTQGFINPLVVWDFFSVLFSMDVNSLTFRPPPSTAEGSGFSGFSAAFGCCELRFFTISAILDRLGVELMSDAGVSSSRSGGGGGRSSIGGGMVCWTGADFGC